MSRKRKPEPDTRYRWDDPNLPFFHPRTGQPVRAEIVHEASKASMKRLNAPHYSQDPSYHWRTKREQKT